MTGRKAIAACALALSAGLFMGTFFFERGTETMPPEPAPAPVTVAAPRPQASPPPPPILEAPAPDGAPNLAGVVVDHQDQPVPGAEVTAYAADLGAERIRSGADGTFAFYGLEDARYRVSAVADGFNEAVIESAAIGSLALTLALEPLSAAGGFVLDAETREPIAEFDVAYLDAPPDGEAHWQRLIAAQRPAWRAAMEPSGAFRLERLASGVPFAIAARARGRQPAYIAVDALQAGEEARALVIYLKAAPRVEGTVTTPRGEPIAGARILLGSEPAGNTVLATSGADGAFSIDGLTGDSVELTAAHANARPATETALLIPGRTARVDFVLDAGAGVEGFVTQGGEPLAGAQVYHFASRRRGVGTRSGSDGYYRLEGLPAGQVLIAASMTTDPGPARMETRELANGTLERVDFDFPPTAASIEGYVTRNGEPLDAMIRAATEAGAPVSPHIVSTNTDADGHYLLEGLGAGVFTVVARHASLGQSVRVTIADGEHVRQDFVFGGGAVISGSVSGLVDGESSEIYLLPPDTDIVEPSAIGAGQWLEITNRSLGGMLVDGGGAYTLDGVQPGSYLAVAVAFNAEGAPGASIADSLRIAQRLIEIREGERLTVNFDLGR